MNDSILKSIKKLLGIAENYTNFDTDIIIHINSAFMTLNQLGVGPANGFKIENDMPIWNQYIKQAEKLEAVKTYIYLKVKLVFDPPLSSSVLNAYNQQINELEWRLNVQAESN